MKKYEALLFDLDGTLFDIGGCEANALRKALQNVGGVGNVDSVWSRSGMSMHPYARGTGRLEAGKG